MPPSGSEHPTNRRNGRSLLASGRPERVAQVRTRRTAPPDQPAADPSSLPVSRPRDPMNQRTPSASTGEFFNTICHLQTSGVAQQHDLDQSAYSTAKETGERARHLKTIAGAEC